HECSDRRSQLGERSEESIEGLPGRTKRILMGDEAGELRGEQEGFRNGVAPRSDRARGRNRVERRVDLHEVEHLTIQSQEIGLRRVSRVEGAHPEVVRVADAPDAQVHGPLMEAEEDGSCAPKDGGSGGVPLSRGMSPTRRGSSRTGPLELHVRNSDAAPAEEQLARHAMGDAYGPPPPRPSRRARPPTG